MDKILHKINYINWFSEAKKKIVTNEELLNLYSELNCKRTKIKYSTKRELYDNTTFSVKNYNKHKQILFWDKCYYLYSTDITEDNKNSKSRDERGPKAIKLVTDKFNELNNATFKTAFDTVEEEFKRCVPKQFTYYNEAFFNKKIKMSSVDFNSQFPANLRGTLPDAHTALKVEGVVKPTEEYPFAFYVESGHMAIYNELDTHDWFKSEWAENLFRFKEYTRYNGQKMPNWPIRNVDNEYTILMKASKYTLTDTYEYFYNIKNKFSNDKESEEYKAAKLVMNSSIGMLHTKKYARYKYAHLVAVCIARANQRMLNVLSGRIIKPWVIQICVDGILYIGNAICSTSRQFGDLDQEFENCDGIISGYNKYIIEKDNKIIKFKFGNCNNTFKPTKLEDQYLWSRENTIGDIINE